MMEELLSMHFDALPPSATAQHKGVFVRNGRVHVFTKQRVRKQEENMVALFHANLPRGWRPLEGPVSLRLKFVFPYRKSEKKAIVRSGLEIPHDVRPDFGNLQKAVEDSLTMAGVWLDDSQICMYHNPGGKWWGPFPYWEVGVARVASAVPQHPPGFGRQEVFRLE